MMLDLISYIIGLKTSKKDGAEITIDEINDFVCVDDGDGNISIEEDNNG